MRTNSVISFAAAGVAWFMNLGSALAQNTELSQADDNARNAPILVCKKPPENIFFINGIATHHLDAQLQLEALKHELIGEKPYSPLSKASVPDENVLLLYNYSNSRPQEEKNYKYASRRRPGIEGAQDFARDKIDETRDGADLTADFLEAAYLLKYEAEYDGALHSPEDQEFIRSEILAGRAREIADKIDHYNNDWKAASECLKRAERAEVDVKDCWSDPESHLTALRNALVEDGQVITVGYSEGSIFAELYRKMLGSPSSIRNVLVGSPVANISDSSIRIAHPNDPIAKFSGDLIDAGAFALSADDEAIDAHSFVQSYLAYGSDEHKKILTAVLDQYRAGIPLRERSKFVRMYGISFLSDGEGARNSEPIRILHQPSKVNMPKDFGSNIASRKAVRFSELRAPDGKILEIEARSFDCAQIASYSNIIIDDHKLSFSLSEATPTALLWVESSRAKNDSELCDSRVRGWSINCSNTTKSWRSSVDGPGKFYINFGMIESKDTIEVYIDPAIKLAD